VIEEEIMLEHIPENNSMKWEIRRLDDETARHYRAELARSEEKQLLKGLTAVGSRALLKLGSALISAGERLSDGRTSGKAAAA
jgi:hypothetical protein